MIIRLLGKRFVKYQPTILRNDCLSIGHFNIHSTSDLWCQEVKLPVLRWLSGVLCVHLRRHASLPARYRIQGRPQPTHQQLVDKTNSNTWVLSSKWFCLRIQDFWGVTVCCSVGTDVSTDRRAFLGFLFAKSNAPWPQCNVSNSGTASHSGQREPASHSLCHKMFRAHMGVAEASRMNRWYLRIQL